MQQELLQQFFVVIINCLNTKLCKKIDIAGILCMDVGKKSDG